MINLESMGSVMASSMERAPWGWVTMSALLLTLVKIWPALSKIASEARAAKRKADTEDEKDCNARIAEVYNRLNDKLDAHIEHAHSLEMKLVGAIAGYKILDAHVEQQDPNDPVLKMSRAAMSTAFSLSPSTSGPPKEPVAVELRN